MVTTAALEASSSSSPSSSSSSKLWKYDLFVSCRGEDTRKGFTENLLCKLEDHKVSVFIDEDQPKTEENITDELKDAIKLSRIFIIVFSKGYADSIRCLEELVRIMDCRRTLGKMVLPIFYDVDPSDVWKQTGTYAEAFQKHEKRFNEVKEKDEKIKVWRNALTEAACIDGQVFRPTDGYEGMFIRKLIEDIIVELKRTYIHVANHPVGIDSRVQEISNYLGVGGLYDVRIIGIWAMGGMGKTTVAKAIFNKYHHRFDGKSFLQNVREKSMVVLQKQLLLDILKPANIEVSSVDEGTKKIENRLAKMRVLVIIDDIDCWEQLDELAIKRESFGPGSRIVITTRDAHLLKMLKVDKICCLRAMNKQESLQLFSWHAFCNRYPNDEYHELSRKVVDYCGGLPLALAVLGSYFCRKGTFEWESALGEMKRRTHGEIHKKLRISYDGLTDDDVKAIFLDISCFFIGMNKEHVMKILEGCDLYPEIGLGELHDRCLVSVDKEGNLMMHDLIRDMGREIERAESPGSPGKRTRLWDHEDVIGVLRNTSGTEDIEGLTLDLQEPAQDISFSTDAFRKMESLRLLKLSYVNLRLELLCKEIRWLCWHEFPFRYMPQDFIQPCLVSIDLSYSKFDLLFPKHPALLLGKLKFLNLSHCHNLNPSPDFSFCPNLEQLILEDCIRLSRVDSSIGQLRRLVLVNLRGCKRLRNLPPTFYELKSIETLLLAGCSSILSTTVSLRTPTADNVAKTTIGSSMKKQKYDTASLRPFLYGLKYLRKLSLQGWMLNLRDDEILGNLGGLIFLESLHLENCSICNLPRLGPLSKLQMLCLQHCENLRVISDLPTNLVVLRLIKCPELETMPDFSKMSNMRELYLSDSFKLTQISGLDKSLNSMTMIHMEGCLNLTAEFRKSILQGWTSCGYGGIFLYGTYIPEWFQFVHYGDVVNFDVPQSDGRKLTGLTLSIVYNSSSGPEDHPLCITVKNKTKRTALSARIADASATYSRRRYLWQGQLSNDVLGLQGGDKVKICVGPMETVDKAVAVIQTGVNLVWDKFMKENMHDWHRAYDLYPQPDCLSGADDAERPRHDATVLGKKLRAFRIDDEDDGDYGFEEDDD